MPSCENGDHIYGHEGVCVFCKQPRPYEPGLAQFDDTWKAILSDPHIANLRQKSSLHEIRRIIMHTSAPFARQQSALADQIAAQSAEIARLREGADETAWLVERDEFDGLRYIASDEHSFAWTRDHSKALRLARKADADALCTIIACTEGLASPDRVAEHMWMMEPKNG